MNQQRKIYAYVHGTTFTVGQTNILEVMFESQGDENAIGFSLHFDSDVLIFLSADTGNGAMDVTLFQNTENLDGSFEAHHPTKGNGNPGNVQVVDTQTFEVVRTIEVDPTGIVLLPK